LHACRAKRGVRALSGRRALESIERPDGRAVELGYDGAGDLESIATSDDSVTVEYWPTGNPKRIATSACVELTYGSGDYDGPLQLQETWSGPVVGSVARTYNRDFRDSTQSVNGQQTVTFAYDADGLVTRAGDLAVVRSAASGRVDSTQLVGVTGRQDYSAYGELANLGYRFGGSTVFQQSMVRDALGRITALQEVAFGTDSLYGHRYDDAGRLYAVTTNGDTTARYWYDANGNCTAFQGRTATDTATADYDEQDRLLRYRDTRYSYTAAGELSLAVTGADTTRYTYDALGNLQRVVANGDTIGYLVDGRNRRVGRTLNGRLVQGWLYQNGLNPVAELDSAGNVVARYVYGTRGHVPDYVVKGGSTYRLITDQLGSVRGVVNAATGAVAERIDYDAWGNVTLDTNPGFVSLGYAGGLRDTAKELVRFGARDYDPSVGRWTCKDPIGFAGGASNMFMYANNAPVACADPGGMWPAAPNATTPFNPPFDRLADKLAEKLRRTRLVDETAISGALLRFPGDNANQNAYRHVAASYCLAREWGPVVAIGAGLLWEVRHPYPKDIVTDVLNDIEGATSDVEPMELWRRGRFHYAYKRK
jgi:RHS repeat-associated protein